MNKTYFARVYQPTVSGTTTSGLIKTITDFRFEGFSWNLNAGQGESIISLPRSIDNFGELDDINAFNQFDIYINDRESDAQGTLVYSGYIVDYAQVIEGSEERIEVTLWDYATEFAVKVLENEGGDTTLAYNSQDPSDILQDVFNRYDGKVGAASATTITTEDFTLGTYFDSGNSGFVTWLGGAQAKTIDQSFSGTQNFQANFGDTNFTNVAQSFIPSADSSLIKIPVKLRKHGSPTDNVSMTIQSDSGGKPSGVVISTSTNTISGSSLTTTPTDQVFSFSGLNLTANTRYWFVVQRSGAADLANNYSLAGLTSFIDGYPNGYESHSSDGGTSWTNDTSVDLFFTQYIQLSSPIIQSLAYDTGVEPMTYRSYSADTVLPTSTAISFEFSDSTDGVNWNDWTSDITSLTHRYFRWRATLTTTSTTTPSINSLTFTVRASDGINQTNSTVSYTFKQNSIKEAIDQCVIMAPAYWYWRVGPENQIYFDQRNTNIVDHHLMIGRDISRAKIVRSVKELANVLYFLGGGDPQLYTKLIRLSSANTQGRRAYRKQDERVTVQGTASTISNTHLDLYDHPMIVAEVEVVDSNGDDSGGYDIELFKPGQIVTINNPATSTQETQWDIASFDVDFWDFPISSVYGVPFQIVSINYSLEKATLQLAYQLPDAAKRIQDINRNLTQNRTQNTPATPTSL